jgi:NADPH2 dehydrogenase
MPDSARPTLGSPMRIRGATAKNRIVVPPMVVCSLHPACETTPDVVAHYAALAAGGCSILIQEATCVSRDGKLASQQLGLWEDGQIDGMRRIVAACRPHGPLLLVQLHHARVKRELATAEVARIRDDFVAAAVRAERAGYDGVELHGAHGYLLCTFLNPRINRRTDRYGEPLQLVREILAGIRAATGDGFLVGIRIGADNPDLGTGIAQCVALEGLGIDFLDVSSGLSEPGDGPLPVPDGFPFSDLAFRGCEVKRHVSVPVIAVGSLNDPARAARLVEEGHADFAAVGRGMLVDPAWARKTLAGEPADPCLDCAICRWFRHPEECPGRRKARSLETPDMGEEGDAT